MKLSPFGTGVVVANAALLILVAASCGDEAAREPVLTNTPTPAATSTPTSTPTPRPSPSPTPRPSPTPTFSEHKIGAEEIPYEDIFRYNEKHIGKRVVFRARILQALEYNGSFDILAQVANPGKTSLVGGVLLIYIDAPVRLLEGDQIEFIATLVGLDTYQSVGAGPITLPLMRIEQTRFLE